MRCFDVVVLCGGYGTRLSRWVAPGFPKVMVDVCGESFLEIVVRYLNGLNPNKIVLSTGYGAEWIERRFAGIGMTRCVVFSCEGDEPRGKASAVELAVRNHVETDQILVVNGDTYCELDVQRLFDCAKNKERTVVIDPSGEEVGAFTFSRINGKFSNLDPRGLITDNFFVADVPFWDTGTLGGLNRFAEYWKYRMRLSRYEEPSLN